LLKQSTCVCLLTKKGSEPKSLALESETDVSEC